MADLPPDDAAYRGTLYTLESERLAVAQVSACWARRLYRLIWALGVIAILVLMVSWVMRVQTSLARLEHGIAGLPAPLGSATPALSPEVRTLEARLARVLSASVESKLRRLEQSVERGTLGGEDLQLLEAAAGELRLLRAQPPGVHGADDAGEHLRYQSVGARPGAGSGADALGQIAELRTFVYVLVSCLALLLLVVLGVWYGRARRVQMLASAPRRQLPAMRASQEKQRGA